MYVLTQDLLAQLEALKEERRQLREDSDLEFGDVDVSGLSEEELSRHLTQVSEYQEQQHRLLKSAINIKIESKDIIRASQYCKHKQLS